MKSYEVQLSCYRRSALVSTELNALFHYIQSRTGPSRGPRRRHFKPIRPRPQRCSVSRHASMVTDDLDTFNKAAKYAEYAHRAGARS